MEQNGKKGVIKNFNKKQDIGFNFRVKAVQEIM